MANELQWVFVAVFLISGISSSTCASIDFSRIHEHMTNEELFSVFNVKDAATVPDYEVVPIIHEQEVHRVRRAISPPKKEVRLTVSGENVKLYLEPVDHVLLGENTPVYTAAGDKSQPVGIRYKRVQKPWPSNFTMYQDPLNNAAMTIFKESSGKINFEGTIGHDLVIKPLPSRIWNSVPSFKSSELASHHVVYRKKPSIIEGINIYDESGEDFWERIFGSRPKKHETPRTETKVDIVYPQVLVIVDHETYLAHGKNVQALCKYMAAFWNAVDLRFRGMSEPKVRLNIAGLIVPTDKKGVRYMEYHREGKHWLRTYETFEDIGKYLYEDDRFSRDMYDLTVAITNLDMCLTEGSSCNPSSRGLAAISGACKHDEESTDLAVALLEDAGSFDGIATAAHEIGHLLGAVHDGDDSNVGPGAMGCEWDDGFLMSSARQSSNGLWWSKCSIEQMRHFLRSEGECLRNKPVVKKPYPKILPGLLLSRDEQCQIMGGMVECKIKQDECGALWCMKPNEMFGDCVTSRAPAEGSSCSDGGICLDGYCVHDEDKKNEVIERITTVAPRSRELIEGAD